jgi:hypothetical protein
MSDLKKQILHGMWKRKDLSYLLHADQEKVRTAFYQSKARKFYLGCSRRWGKSFFKCVTAAEKAITVDNSEIRYAAPTQKMAKQIVEPHFRRIFNDAPDDVRPDFRVQEQIWRFPNGSSIILAGVDNGGAERLRGTSTTLALVDEAGLMDDLDYLIQDILLPQTITVNGRILIGSTPPRTPAHPFKRQCQDAMMNGAYIKRTIYDAPHINEGMIEEYMYESGGKDSTTWKREYLVEFVTDENLAIVPEWSRLMRGGSSHPLVMEWARPKYYNCWVVADVGFNDLTAIGFFYVDFASGKIVLEDELYMVRTRSDAVNAKVRAKLAALGYHEPQSFTADTLAKNTIVDMSDDETSWSPPPKHNAEGALNNLRLAIQRGQLIIHPRCKVTISHLENGIWNKSKQGFERSDEFGHFDGIDMLKYGVRVVDLTANPYPDDDLPSLDEHHVRGRMRSADSLESLFTRRGH